MISAFLQSLFQHGNVRVGHPDELIERAEWLKASNVLLDLEIARRAEFPGVPPAFELPVALWATRMLYRGCQAVTFRDLPGESLNEFLGESCPAAEAAARHYSVDLVFQFLPDLMKLARHIAPGDPLLEVFSNWANEHPLSSIGIEGTKPRSLNGILQHPGLLQYYVDRVVARRDANRLSEPAVLDAVRRAVGIHRERFPEFDLQLR